MAQLTLTVEARLTDIRIDNGRLSLGAILVETSSGLVLRQFREDVTDQLTATQLAGIGNLEAKAQAWLDAKLAGG